MTGKTSHRRRMKEASERSYPPDSLLNQALGDLEEAAVFVLVLQPVARSSWA
jgi:hypothetical protein